MKPFLQKLRLTSLLCHYKYHLTADLKVIRTAQSKSINMLASVCFLDRDLFWATTRSYADTTIFDLKNIIKAEEKQLPPMKGHFLWSIKEITSSSIAVDYFVIPEHVMDKVPKECKFVMPLFQPDSATLESPLSMNHQSEVDCLKHVKNISWINLIGLSVKLNTAQKSTERLSNKNLLISLLGISCFIAVMLSGYMFLSIQYYQSLKTENRDQVNAVLSLKQKYAENQEQVVGFVDFLKASPNVLNKLSQLKLSTEGVFFENLKLINSGFRISGTTKKSATKLLEEILQSELVKEAKFTRAVTKNRLGEEVFAIDVVWK